MPWALSKEIRLVGKPTPNLVGPVRPFSFKRHRFLTEYVTWFNRWRPHRSLGQQPPCPEMTAVRFSIRNGTGITARPVLGGLHHVYELAA